ncbi:hypothetical protein jhhlp_004971 [Lomentospora prolificans]|uniref:Uncharacterized protein n=1 Tax=Lomentospora prolificans TaxID=41688 RepID=A0A2N3N828_9PEZI|nr:hypothetical protein jhhlp_004971 [Lomentospora prolificans]
MLDTRGEVAISAKQLRDLTIVMRFASTLSAIGVITIITVFCLSRHFRNPMHRLIFINAFFNAFDVTCTMISTSGPKGGNPSALCQFQGFLNQMFPVADVLWTLVMAVNVYLIVFRRYDTDSLRRLEWKYLVGISVLTFIPAFVFLFIRSEDKGPMYGSVTLWCAIAPKWVLFRIVVYYGTIWTSILVTMILYILVGVEIAKRRLALRYIASDSIPLDQSVLPKSDMTFDDASIGVAVTVDVDVDIHPGPQRAYTAQSYDESLQPASICSISTSRPAITSTPARPALSFKQYVLMPLFFFLALLSVWVAPSTNRVASFIDPSFSSYPLLVAVGISGSLRGFWNGLVFITIGMKSWKRRKEADDSELRRM